MLHRIALSLALLIVAPALAAQDPTAEDWISRLSGDERAAARQELIALGRKASPILVELITKSDADTAWQAVTLEEVARVRTRILFL